jgi:nucleotide-binding universal stress UspA family protein
VKRTGRILVPVNGTPSDQEALDLACLMARKQRSRVAPIYVIRVRRNLPLDAEMEGELAHGEEVLEGAERAVAGLELPAETSLLQARDVGAAIVDEATQTGADLIVMGLPYKRKFGDYELGPTATYVLRNAPCRVWITRATMPS